MFKKLFFLLQYKMLFSFGFLDLEMLRGKKEWVHCGGLEHARYAFLFFHIPGSDMFSAFSDGNGCRAGGMAAGWLEGRGT